MTAERRAAISMSIGVASAVSLYGISFGALAVASGLDVWQAQVLSLFMFSGGSQFAVIGLIAAPSLVRGRRRATSHRFP